MADIDRILLVVSVLPDEINQGYEETRFAVLKTVNGKPVSNLAQLRAKMQEKLPETDKAAAYQVLGFGPHDTQIMFSRKSLAERQPVIAERYRIPARQ
jgi:hypothetical protein